MIYNLLRQRKIFNRITWTFSNFYGFPFKCTLGQKMSAFGFCISMVIKTNVVSNICDQIWQCNFSLDQCKHCWGEKKIANPILTNECTFDAAGKIANIQIELKLRPDHSSFTMVFLWRWHFQVFSLQTKKRKCNCICTSLIICKYTDCILAYLKNTSSNRLCVNLFKDLNTNNVSHMFEWDWLMWRKVNFRIR